SSGVVEDWGPRLHGPSDYREHAS
ncbi:MOSC domain-containing protein, partial [Pseudomonas aeruginosa]